MSKPDAAASRPAAPSRRAGYAKSLDTRARILAAALEEAGNSGFHNASVARIAARAGVAVGNLHYHFGSRGELLRELMGALMADLLPRLHAADAGSDADFFERERAGLLVYLDYLRAHPAHVRLASEIKLHEPELYRSAVAGWVERIAARIRVGIERGTVKPMDDAEISALAHLLLGASQFLEHMVENVRGRAYPGDAAVVDAYVALLRGGLGRAPRSGTETTRRTGAAAGAPGSQPSGRTARRRSSSRSRRGKR
jgi:AcrR family transcriptional regulator